MDNSQSGSEGQSARWPREIVVENGDGTVSLFADVETGAPGSRIIRGRRADDRVRESRA